MDLGLTEAQEILKTAAADFVRQEYDKDTLIALENTPTGVTPEIFRQAADLGWLGILIPESYGGTDRSLTDTAVLFEELGRGPVLGPHFSSSVLGALIVLRGAPQRRRGSDPHHRRTRHAHARPPPRRRRRPGVPGRAGGRGAHDRHRDDRRPVRRWWR